jgi:hypothetical protein
MCLACQEQEYFFRLWCADFLARGEMPPGVTSDDLEALGLPPPKPAGVPERGPDKHKRQQPTPAANTFACDSPDE